MSIKRVIWIALTMAVLQIIALPGAAQANVAQPPERMAFEFFDASGQRVMPITVQLAGCPDEACLQPTLLFQRGICNLPGCLPSPVRIARPVCNQTMCCVEAFVLRQPYYKLIVLPPYNVSASEASAGVFQGSDIGPGNVRGLRVVMMPDGLEITEDPDLAASTPGGTSGYSLCPLAAAPMTTGLAITQAVELLVAFLLVLLLGIPLRLIGDVLTAVALINFATFPVVWLTFPALGPDPNTQEQAVAVFTLLAALIYASLLLKLRPTFDPARRAIVVGLLVMALPAAIVLVFGAATAASAAVNAAGLAGAAAAGAGLPYHITMPASEVFAYSAEATLFFLLCQPVLSARHAVLLAILANSASLALGLVLL
jgi:hypothetical protein